MDLHHPLGATKGVAIGEAIRYPKTNTDKKNFHKNDATQREKSHQVRLPKKPDQQNLEKDKVQPETICHGPQLYGQIQIKETR